MQKPFYLAGVLVVLSVAGLGCNPFASVSQKVTDNAVEQAIKARTGIDVNVNGSGSLSSDFPTDVPRYPGATYVSSMVQAKIAIANFTTKDDAQKVSDYYDAQLKAAGFTGDLTEVMNGTVKLYHKDNISITVSAFTKEDGSLTSVSLQRVEKDDNQN
jgi:hypothetical protein